MGLAPRISEIPDDELSQFRARFERRLGKSVTGKVYEIEVVVDDEKVNLGGLARLLADTRHVVGIGERIDEARLAHIGAADKGVLRQAVVQDLVLADDPFHEFADLISIKELYKTRYT